MPSKQRSRMKITVPETVHVGDTVELKGVDQECLIEEIHADGYIVVRVDSWITRSDDIERVVGRAADTEV